VEGPVDNVLEAIEDEDEDEHEEDEESTRPLVSNLFSSSGSE
jgi:hypothetical protein